MEGDPACDGDRDQHTDLEAGDRERDEEVAEHEQSARDRRGEQLALGAVLAVADHAEPGEHRVQRDQQAECADRDERLVGDAGVECLLEGWGDHEREQDRREERHDELAGSARGELEAAPRQGREPGDLVSGLSRKWGADAGERWAGMAFIGDPFGVVWGQAASARRSPVSWR